MYLQAMESVLASSSKVLVDTKSAGNMMYLPLDRLTRQGGASLAAGRNESADAGGLAGQSDIQSLTDQVLRELRNRQSTNTRTGR